MNSKQRRGVYVLPGVRHGFSNTGTARLVVLVITTPADDREEAR